MSEQKDEARTKVDVNVVQVVASALAAVSSAVLLSTLGTAGTIIGAAVGSIIATVGGAVYSYSLRVSRERVAAVQAAAIAKVNRRRTGSPTRQIEVEAKGGDQGRAPWREALARLPWKWIAIVAAAVFVIAMIVIISFELITGRSVSTVTGGSDGGGHRTSLGFGHSSKASKSPSPTPSSSTTPKASSTTRAPGSTSRPSAGVTRSTGPTATPSASLPTETSSSTSSPSSSPSD